MHLEGKATGEPGRSADEVAREGHPLPGLPCCRSETGAQCGQTSLQPGFWVCFVFQPLVHTHVRFGMRKRGREALPALLQPKTRCRCASPANTGPPLRPASCVLCLHRCMWALALWVWRGGMRVFRSCCGPRSQSPEMAYAPSLQATSGTTGLLRGQFCHVQGSFRGGGRGGSGGEPLPLPCPQRYSHFTPVGNPFCLDREDLPP